MRVSVYLDNQPFLRAKEIDNTTADYVLTPEFVSAELRTAESSPQQRFERSSFVAEPLGSTEQVSVLHHLPSLPLPLP